MNNRQEDKMSMYEKVVYFLNQNINTISPVVGAVTQVKTDFEQKLDAIIQVDTLASMDITGYTEVKSQKRKAMELLTLKVGRAITAYATFSNQSDLKEKANYTKTGIERMRDTECYTTARRIYELAMPIVTDLQPFTVDIQVLKDLDIAKEAFFQVLQLPKSKIGERVTQNEQINQLLAEADSILKDKLDIYMALLEFDYAALYSQYQNARAIDVTGTYSSGNSYSGSLLANQIVVVFNAAYSASRSITLKNKGNTQLTFGHSNDMQTFIGNTIVLDAGDILLRDSSDLATEGDYLLVQNMGASSGEYAVETDE